MKTEGLKLLVSPSIGKVSAEYIIPDNAASVITLAHGAGAGMNHSFMVTLANSLAEAGIASLRFNFPFLENKKGRPDVPAVAHQTINAAMQHAHQRFPDLPLFLSGKSFGGRMSSQFLALNKQEAVKGIIFYGFPLHAMGKPSVDRAEHLRDVKQPMLFLQGTRDTLASIDLIESVTSALSNATLITIEGADHAFKAGKQDILSLLVQYTREWTTGIIAA